MDNNDRQDTEGLKRGIYFLLAIMIIGFIFTVWYYTSVKKQADNIDIEKEISKVVDKKREDEGIDPGIIEIENDKVNDLIKESEEKQSKSKHPETHNIVNNEMREFTDKDFENLKNEAYMLAKGYNWDGIIDLEARYARTFDFGEKVEASNFLAGLVPLEKLVYNETLPKFEREVILSRLNDPLLFAYAFFSQKTIDQGNFLKNKNSMIVYTVDQAPDLVSLEEVAPREYGVGEYYAHMDNIKAYKLQFEISNGLIDLIVINNNGFIEGISLLPSEGEDFEYVTIKEFEDEFQENDLYY